MTEKRNNIDEKIAFFIGIFAGCEFFTIASLARRKTRQDFPDFCVRIMPDF